MKIRVIDPAADVPKPSGGRVARGGALGKGDSLLDVPEKRPRTFHRTPGRAPGRALCDRPHDPLSEPGRSPEALGGHTRRGRRTRQLSRSGAQDHGRVQTLPRWSAARLLSPRRSP